MKHFLSGLWLLTTITGVGCAVGSSADLGTDALPATRKDEGPGDASMGSEAAAALVNGGASVTSDGGASKGDGGASDASVDVAESGVDSAAPGACAFAGELVSFDLAKLSGTPSTVAPTAVGPGVVATPLRRVGVTAASSAGALNSSGWPTGALDPAKHFAFSITPPSGCKLTATTLTIDLKASSTGPTQASVGTSADGYAHLEAIALVAAGGATSVPLVGGSGASGSVEVHVFGFAADATTGTLRIQDTLSVTGTLGN